MWPKAIQMVLLTMSAGFMSDKHYAAYSRICPYLGRGVVWRSPCPGTVNTDRLSSLLLMSPSSDSSDPRGLHGKDWTANVLSSSSS